MRDGMITEEQCGENFAYILEDKTDFLITEYKMMHGQEALPQIPRSRFSIEVCEDAV